LKLSHAVIAALAAVLAACSTNGSITTLTDSAQIAQVQKDLLEQTMDLSKITVAYLKVEGQNVQIASIMPVVLGESKSGREVARSIARITPGHDGLTLFTRDAKKRLAYMITVPFAELERRRTVVFPLLGASGELVEKKITFDKAITK